VTNKSAFQDMLLHERSLFDKWGIELIEKWVWLKVTTHGEPMCALDSVWRKPYEILLVGQKKRATLGTLPYLKTKIVIGVPDMHSRKPNLKALFEKMMGRTNYLGLEIFARNLTAGWWAWGNEVLQFQTEEHWKD
jgi:N6-adenosine-specific RNA methylase IME4